MQCDFQIINRHRGMTINELIIVIALIAILIYFLTPTGGHPRHMALAALNQSYLRQIGVAFTEYCVDNEDFFPGHPRAAAHYLGDSDTINEVFLGPYLDEQAIIDGGDADGNAVRYGGYVFINLGLNYEDISDPSSLILTYTALVSEDQKDRGVLYADGHTDRLKEEDLRGALPDEIDVDALDGP